jgi:hypothetical protein
LSRDWIEMFVDVEQRADSTSSLPGRAGTAAPSTTLLPTTIGAGVSLGKWYEVDNFGSRRRARRLVILEGV